MLGRKERTRASPRARWNVPENRGPLIAAALLVSILVWAAVAAWGTGFAVLVSDKLGGSEESVSAFADLFAALVLGLFLAEDVGRRARWVAGGLVALASGHLLFGYLEPLVLDAPADLNEALYEGFVARTLACALLAVGLFPGTPPRLFVRAATIVPLALLSGYFLIFEILQRDGSVPPMVRVDGLREAFVAGSPFLWLTPWHWALSAIPLGLALVAAVGTFRLNRRGLLPGWLLVAMVLFFGSLLHEYLWPSTYAGEVLTTGDALRLAFAVVVAVGGVAELRRAASERAALLTTERERTRRLKELATLKADFGAMIAHELSSPLVAVRRLAELLGAGGLDARDRTSTLGTIEGELDAVDSLVADVRAAAEVERDDFEVDARPVPLSMILADAEAHARILPAGHPVTVKLDGLLEGRELVYADPERIGQVMKNLLSNAAKYSPEGAPIKMRARRNGGRVRIEVADYGPGIHPDDVARIFEKFGRGRDREGQRVTGAGLGLYLSRRIVGAHGSDLTVETKEGEGSVFSFEIEVAR